MRREDDAERAAAQLFVDVIAADVVGPAGGGQQLPALYGAYQGQRLRPRRDAQLHVQQAAVVVEVGQGRAAPAAAGQQFDQLPVAGLVQRVDSQLPPGVGLGRGELFIGQVDGRQPLQGQQDAAPVRLAPGGPHSSNGLLSGR